LGQGVILDPHFFIKMNENQTTYGIIGDPLTHSLSPVMQNAAFKELGVDAQYELFPLQEDEVEKFFKDLKNKNSPIFGLNVTVPYKETVIKYLDKQSPLVQKIQAVNTIVINEKRELIGFNTDAPGFLAHLKELKCATADSKIAILGAGGSTRAVLAALCMVPERPERIKIYNRTESRLRDLIKDLSERIELDIVEVAMSVDDLNLEEADLLINTTSLGMKRDDICLVDEGLLHKNMLVYDIVYNPAQSKLLEMAKMKGARTSNGLGMLYYQGVLALQHWAEKRNR